MTFVQGYQHYVSITGFLIPYVLVPMRLLYRHDRHQQRSHHNFRCKTYLSLRLQFDLRSKNRRYSTENYVCLKARIQYVIREDREVIKIRSIYI